MKSYEVTLEARVTMEANSEEHAVNLAKAYVHQFQTMLIPTQVIEGWPKAWKPKKSEGRPLVEVLAPGQDKDEEVPF